MTAGTAPMGRGTSLPLPPLGVTAACSQGALPRAAAGGCSFRGRGVGGRDEDRTGLDFCL